MHLRLLILPTCVGFRYGPSGHVLRRFSRRRIPLPSLPRRVAPPRIASDRLLSRPSTALLRDGVPSPRAMYASRHAFVLPPGGGFFTALPSATALALALGSDFPGADCPCPGDLRFSVGGDLTRLFVTYACILPSASSSAARAHAFAGPRNAPLPVHTLSMESRASVPRLAPLHCLRGGARPVSCYALFQGMAASEPTSWLSAHPHLISHSAWFRDLSRRSGLFPSRPRTLSHAVSLPRAGSRHSEFDRAW